MSEVSERVGVTCPSCSPGVATTHEVLKAGGQYTVRCLECGHVHKTTVDDDVVERDVVVSQEGESFTATVDVPPAEPLTVGDEFVLETDAGIFTVRITALEVGDERRETRAEALDVETIWTRDVGNVAVDVTVHPADGAADETESLTVRVPGEDEFVVGDRYEFGDREFEVEGIHVRDTAVEHYQFEKLGHEGDAVLAKDIKRVYAAETGRGSAWSAW